MKARDVVGRRIVAVNQTPVYGDGGRLLGYHVDSIVLDNGWQIGFTVAELPADYGVIGNVYKLAKGG